MLLLAAAAFAQAPAPGAPSAPTAAPAPTVEAAPSMEVSPTGSALAIDPSDLIGAPAGPPVTGEALREKTHTIAKLMRCPVCQGLSVADSRSESALAMKDEVQDLVAQGYDAEQVLLYFEASYGEFIRLEPKFEGVNLLVWGAPVLLLLGGVGWVFSSVYAAGRRKAGAADVPGASGSASSHMADSSDGMPPATPAVTPTPSTPDTDAMAAYLRRVREESR